MSRIRDIYNMDEDEEERVVIVNKELEGKLTILSLLSRLSCITCLADVPPAPPAATTNNTNGQPEAPSVKFKLTI